MEDRKKDKRNRGLVQLMFSCYQNKWVYIICKNGRMTESINVGVDERLLTRRHEIDYRYKVEHITISEQF